MEFTTLHILWLISAFTLTTQELVGLSVSPRITAECGKQVTLQCKLSSSPNGLSIKHIEWSRGKTFLCSVNGDGKIMLNTSLSSDVHCVYEEGQLSLIFQQVQPRESGDSESYRCKLQSNKGADHKYTTVELQECCQNADGFLRSDGPACIFTNVYPDGDVHWFHGSHNLSAGSVKTYTTKSVEEGGWLTIHSYLERKGSHVPYNCSLKGSKSGRYIASTLVETPEAMVRGWTKNPSHSGVGSQAPMRTLLCISTLLAVMLK